MNYLRKRILHLSDIPADLDSVISIDHKKEVEPQQVGMAQADIDEIWHNLVTQPPLASAGGFFHAPDPRSHASWEIVIKPPLL